MIRKGAISSLLFLSVNLIALSLSAQQKTNTAALQRMEQKLVAAEQKITVEKQQLAVKYNWTLKRRSATGGLILLTGVDAFGYPVYTVSDNLNAAKTTGTNQLWNGGNTGFNLSGSSTFLKGKLAIWDEGKIRNSHVEITDRVLFRDDNVSAELSDHATHVAGTMIASGIRSDAKGMAYNMSDLIAYDFDNHLGEITREASNLLLSNHSYGIIAGWYKNSEEDERWEYYGEPDSKEDFKFGYYDSHARSLDEIAYEAPYYLIVKSAGNSRSYNGPAVGENYWGYNSSASPSLVNKGARPADISSNDGFDGIATYGVAKNILTVGAIMPLANGYTNPAEVVMTDFSSWGPTDDGRIKPDVVADGYNVLSPIGKSADDTYGRMSGTSMATPGVTGSLLLLQELYARLNTGSFMRAASLKGLVIHTADEAGNHPGPDYKFGWGVVNAVKAARLINSQNTDKLILEQSLQNAGSYQLQVYASGNEPLIATICWTDPEGNVNTTSKLNNRTPNLRNDLDLRITQEDITYFPWKLDVNNPQNQATNGDNTLDNVEKIEIEQPTLGKLYTIHVTHKNTLIGNEQAFSLIVSGTSGCDATTVTAPVIVQDKSRLISDNPDVQWWKDDVLLMNGAISKDLVLVTPGKYHATISYNNCQLSSNIIDADPTTIIPELEAMDAATMVFPNPTKGNIRIAFHASQPAPLSMMIVNASGTPFYQESIPNFSGSYEKDVQLKAPKGIYWLKIQHGKLKKQQKILLVN